MNKRRLLIVAGALTLLGMAGFTLFLWLTTPPPGVTRENFRRLRVGMSLPAVEALLGGPKTFSDYPRVSVRENPPGAFRPEVILTYLGTKEYWVAGDGLTIEVDFDKGGRVDGGRACAAGMPDETIPQGFRPLARLRQLLGW
jgi:hypothetical protein